MAEAEAVLALDQRPVWFDQVLADERGEARCDLGLVGCERLDGAAVEDLALDRAPFEHAALAGSSWSRRAASRACRVGGTTTSPSVSAAIASISSMKSGLPPAARAILCAPVAGDALRDQLVDVVGAEGLEPERHRPGGVALAELGPGHAEQEDRRARGEERDVLDQVVKRLLAPLDVVEDDHKRPIAGRVLQRLAERPGDLLRRRRRLALAEQRADRRRSSRVGGSRSSCFSTSTTGQ